jgi:uncharacterized protein YxjI
LFLQQQQVNFQTSGIMTILPTLPAPGVGIFPNFIARKEETLIMKSESFSRSWKISLHDGTPIMTVKGEHLSASHRKTVLDPQGQKLGQIRRQTWSFTSTYYAEASEGGPRLWELKSHMGFPTSKNTVSFANAAGDGKSAELNFKKKGFGASGVVTLAGQDVAIVEKKHWKMRTEYHITVAPGLDMFLPIGLMVALDDKIRTAKQRSGGGGGGGAGA